MSSLDKSNLMIKKIKHLFLKKLNKSYQHAGHEE